MCELLQAGFQHADVDVREVAGYMLDETGPGEALMNSFLVRLNDLLKGGKQAGVAPKERLNEGHVGAHPLCHPRCLGVAEEEVAEPRRLGGRHVAEEEL